VQEQRAEGVNSEDDEYIELWNLVFMQYNRDEQGKLTPLDIPAVDTGMGLERLVSVLQGVKSTYETDLFQPILKRLVEMLGTDQQHYQGQRAIYHAIADHSRSIAFLLAEGVRPGNGGREYVLRRLIRRASYLGKTLGFERPFLASLVEVVVDMMGECYPELLSQRTVIVERTTDEEKRFQRTLASGLRQIEVLVEQLSEQGGTILSGYEAFKLHDTYGFPLDLTQKILGEHGLSVNVAEYEEGRQEQQQRSRSATLLKRRSA